MKNLLLTLLLIRCVWFGAGIAQAQSPGTVLTWGGFFPPPLAVPLTAQSGVTAVAAGGAHSVALKNDGSVVAWGLNDYGQTTVPVVAQSGVAAIAAGFSHTVALRSDGSMLAWGRNDSGQTTVPVMAQSGVTAIVAGSAHTVALKNDGSVMAWGLNDYGQTTVPVMAQSGVTAIAAGYSHTVALRSDGSVVAWGRNDYGQTTVPVTAWGVNWNGQLGDGTFSNTNRPAPVGSDHEWLLIAASGEHTTALKADGSLWNWGANGSGQLGTGTTKGTNAPARVGTDNDWAVPAPPASEFRITRQAVDGDGRFRISFTTTNSRSYFILYRGTEVTHIQQPVDATFGPFVFQLSDPTPVSSNTSGFYRIRAVPFAQPLDSDGDGIDDAFELRHRSFLNPFNPADAALDYDGDGRSNLQEYRDGTDPATPP